MPIAVAAVDARRVVVAQRVAGPGAGRQRGQPLLLVGAHPGGRDPFGLHQREIEGQMHFVVPVAVVGDLASLAHQQAVGVLVHDRSQFLHQLVQARLFELVLEDLFPLFDYLCQFLFAAGGAKGIV